MNALNLETNHSYR